jgi:hypothetical protein
MTIRFRLSTLGAAVALLLLAACVVPEPLKESPAVEATDAMTPDATRATVEGAAPGPVVSNLSLVAQITGEESMNQTDSRFSVAGTDLGHMFDMDGRLYMVFGDTFGCCIGGGGGPDGAEEWRKNTMAIIDDRDPSDGLEIAAMIEDRPGHAAQLLRPGRDDVTTIPTNGIAIGQRMYLHYMGVTKWGNPGSWDLSLSGIAYSDDAGQSWTKDEDAIWPGDSNFGQVAFAQQEGYVYLLGIPGGRFGAVQLARVPEDGLLDPAAYEYLAAIEADTPLWSADPNLAQTLVPARVGEISALWNPALERWLLTYLNEDRAALVIRSAPALWGPWSDESVLVSGADYPQLYGAYMHPWLLEEEGETVYFTMSLWRPYNVFLMRATLHAPEE